MRDALLYAMPIDFAALLSEPDSLKPRQRAATPWPNASGVRESGSLNKAAKSMGMAYSKAWRIMKSAEANLGFDLLFRAGAHGSTLTREGENLLAAYDGLLEQTRDFARKALEETVRD